MTKDPLLLSSPDQQKALFDAFCQVANGFSAEQVVGAAANMIVNGLRQAHATRDAAMNGLDRVAAQAKTIIDGHYDATGKRRNVFPFHQMLEVSHQDFRNVNYRKK